LKLLTRLRCTLLASQIDVNSFEKVEKAVKDRIAAIETPAPLLVQ